jgi:thiol-disulfide isomerase/thioredoxin
MKRIILFPFITLITLQLAAQSKTVTIQGIVKDTSLKSIEITYPADVKVSKWESTKLNVKNGTFKTSIIIPFPVEIGIFNDKNAYTTAYNKNYIYGDVKIVIDTAGEWHIVGSPIQEEYQKEFLPFFQSNNQLIDSLKIYNYRNYQKYHQNLPQVLQDSVTFLRKKYYSQRANLLYEYIKLHPNSYVALWDINFYVMVTPLHQYFDFQKLFSSFSSKMQQLPFMSSLKEKLKESDKLQVGQLFPKDFFKGYEQMQNKIKKDNQYYLVDFWYSHCGPCRARFPKLIEIYDQFHSKGFDVVSISVDKQKDKKDYLGAIKKNKLVWNHIWDKDGVKADRFDIIGFPTYILLDKNDRIIKYDIQGSELETFLKQNL